MTEFDEHWMHRALALAKRGRGFVEPNPAVGAVIVNAAGEKVGEGWHARFGGDHAEVAALAAAGSRAAEGTLYVTLEPCCHHGKTPPCTDAILRAGLRRVVVAMNDPFPQVNGQGIALLRAAGIEVTVGVLEAEARRFNAPFMKRVIHNRPWVHVKWAMTLDGRIATSTGDSKWISNAASRAKVHALRGRMDAIIVGRGTLIADDPLLTARPPGPRTAMRVVVTATGDLPAHAQLLGTINQAPVIVYTRPESELKLDPWRNAGAEIVVATEPDAILADLANRGATNVLLEGGAGLLGSFLDAGCADEVHAFIAPKIVGGATAPGPIGGRGQFQLVDAIHLHGATMEQLDADLYWHGYMTEW